MITTLLNLWVLPRNVAIAFVLLWRKLISPLYGDVCRYYPSCSAYGLGSLQQHGIVYGSALTIWRILRCNPFLKGGVDEVSPGPKWISIADSGLVYVRSSSKAKREG